MHVWLDAIPVNLLPQITDISVAVQDVDLRSILHLRALNKSSPLFPRLSTWDLYEAEISRLILGLERLPRIKTITLQSLSHSQSYLYDEFVSRVLTELRSTLLEVRVLHAP
ncbi:hypothetical protein G6011_11526 [Alternaria panax]|uniref:Uncharacterized protein n=1 Tax=Alternaria panax TaxID=48097 RepID=A0AAD4IDK3_9PLEO|nr:hypothetical protein G6011_11526 [Alternaria panax]